MKLHGLILVAAAFVMAPVWAQSTTPAAADAAVTAVCKDGSQFSGKTLRGACRGHGGVDKGAKAAAAADAAGAATAEAPVEKKPHKERKAQAATATSAAAPGRPGEVWVNTDTKVFHCEGSRYYGKTKKGEYMSEKDALAQGFHAAKKEKACTAG